MKPAESPPPARSLKTYRRVLWAQHGKPAKLLSFNSRVQGCWMHFANGYTLMCYKAPGRECPFCDKNYHRLWYGWLFGHSQAFNCRALLQIPFDGYNGSAALQNQGRTLRGAEITLTRMGGSNKASVAASIRYEARALEAEPEPDTMFHVEHCYQRFLDSYLARFGGEI